MKANITISFSPNEKEGRSELALQMYKDELEKVGKIEKDTIVFRTIYVYENSENIEAKLLVINTLSQDINLDMLTFQLSDEEKSVISEKSMDLSNLGIIHPMNAVPFSIFFNKPDIKYSINDKWKVYVKEGIEAKDNIRFSVDYIDEAINQYESSRIKQYIEHMPPVNNKAINLIVFKHIKDENGVDACILLVVNGTHRPLIIPTLNLIYKDKLQLTRAIKKVQTQLNAKPWGVSAYLINIEPNCIIRTPFEPENLELSFEL